MTEHPESTPPPGIDVIFLAPPGSSGAAPVRRTVAFAPGEPLPRVGECVIIDFEGEARRWQVQGVAHVFEQGAHGVAIKLMAPVDG